MSKYAQVVVNVPLSNAPTRAQAERVEDSRAPLPWFERAFTYDIPLELCDSICLGQLVWVPFGARRVQGIIVGFADTTELTETRAVQEIAISQPLVSETQIRVAHWIAQRYLAPLAQCIWLFLPPGIEEKVQTIVEHAPNAPAADSLTDKQRAVLERVRASGKLKTARIPLSLRGALDSLITRGYLEKHVQLNPPAAKPRHIQAVRLLVDAETARRKLDALPQRKPASDQAHFKLTAEYLDQVPALSEAQARVCVYLREQHAPATAEEILSALHIKPNTLRTLEEKGWIERVASRLAPLASRLSQVIAFLEHTPNPVWISALYAATNATRADLEKLERLGILSLETTEVIRDPLANRTFTPRPAPSLTIQQERVWRTIAKGLSEGSPWASYLIHGVTGSGKTEIYLRAIEAVREQGKQAIALVPEISLTPQTIQRFGERFGERIGVIHSRLSPGERYDTWRQARAGKLDVIIGPRSALFAPLPRLGLIVLDEEHDASYKSDMDFASQPAYHAREVALELGRQCGAVVILGSATPDVETYTRARQHEITLLELPNRLVAHGAPGQPVHYQSLPPVTIVDLRRELVEGNRSIFSRALKTALNETLAKQEQAILFLNRRGSANAIVCRDCGHALRCPRCNNPYTLHQFGAETARELVCHHCGKRGAIPRKCPNCGSTRIRPFGLGTEKLEELVHQEFPAARTLRWDYDATRDKDSHEHILDTFVRREADVLIGTQMIAKGLDLPRVTLVGVVNADTGLHLPDFRASERTFQLLTQVAGRAGRSALGGRAIIQTYYPEQYAIATAAHHDYGAFYAQELQFRREASYPPIRPLTRLLYTHAQRKQAADASERVAFLLHDRVRRLGILDVEIIGPAPAFFGKLRGQHRYQLLLRGQGAHELLARYPLSQGWKIDVDPLDLL